MNEAEVSVAESMKSDEHEKNVESFSETKKRVVFLQFLFILNDLRSYGIWMCGGEEKIRND